MTIHSITQDFIKMNCGFIREEEVIRALGVFVISLRCRTSNGTCSYSLFSKSNVITSHV
jgi:hypothetical protein